MYDDTRPLPFKLGDRENVYQRVRCPLCDWKGSLSQCDFDEKPGWVVCRLCPHILRLAEQIQQRSGANDGCC